MSIQLEFRSRTDIAAIEFPECVKLTWQNGFADVKARRLKVLAVIPARYSSTRFAGKVLAKDTGKFLIQHTYERACSAKLPEKVIIAADDEKVVAAARTFGAECVLTSPEHQSGTDRIAEAVAEMDVEIVINLQGDEPEIDPDNIDYLARLLMDNPDCPMATLSADFQTAEQVADPNIVKVIIGCNDQAIYFSRSPIPYDREKAGVGAVEQYQRHLGIYAYRKQFLLEITSLPQTPLEMIEKLEQLRAIENGYPILVGKVEHTCDGIDTPEQYAEFVRRYSKDATVIPEETK
jgi:3-deoxy-manno-octulosonate cytidylyltransferase (CMP-KDO synthetase)